MEKLDLKKIDKAYYQAKKEPFLKTFSSISYLSIVGSGAPGGEAFTQRIETLYPLAYGIKKIYQMQGKDFTVPSLEGMWWVEGDSDPRNAADDDWHWKLLIRMPDFVTSKAVEEARKIVSKKKDLHWLSEVAFEHIEEGKCVQVLHIGAYNEERATIDKVYQFMDENQLQENGYHHEIYLSDPRRTATEKLKTIIRYPVK